MPSRSFHFIPGHKPRLFSRLADLAADHVVFDLEDAVPSAEKSAARRRLDSFFRETDIRSHFVRIHEPGHVEYSMDLELLRAWPTLGVVVPKFAGADDWTVLRRECGVDERRSILLLEGFGALPQLEATFARCDRLPFGVGLGFEDMLADVPFRADDLEHLLRHIRTGLAVWGRAHGVLTIDGISAADAEDSVFREHCLEARSCGLQGKLSIHPRQIALINESFSPSSEMVQWAEKIARLTGLQEHFGYERMGNEVITPPKIKKARHILAMHGKSQL
jgi:citrate lyase subunit beta / citryl-CoA lyase